MPTLYILLQNACCTNYLFTRIVYCNASASAPQTSIMKTLFFTLKKNPFATILSISLIGLFLLSHPDRGLSPFKDYALSLFMSLFAIGLLAFVLRYYKIMAVAFIACWVFGYSLQEQEDAWSLMAKSSYSAQDTFSIAYVDLGAQSSTMKLAREVALFKPDILLLVSYHLEHYPQLNEALRQTYPYGRQLLGDRALFSRNAVFIQKDLQEEVVEIQRLQHPISIATVPSGFLLLRNRDWTTRVQLQPSRTAEGARETFRYTSAFRCIEWRAWSQNIKHAYLGFFQLRTDSVSQATISKL